MRRVPRLGVRRLWQRIRDRLRSRITIPIVRRTITGWTLLATVGVLGIAAVGGTAITNRSIFCSSCHEMGVHCRTWELSSHKGVECEQCHIMPGIANMVRAKLSALRLVYMHVKGASEPNSIRGHVPDANCKKCHDSTREVVVYHGLKITHKAHWDMGVGCTFCHDRVVHGRNAATKNTPTMSRCFQCHDGRMASNKCGMCHETLGIRQPTVFSAEWVKGHKEEVAGDRASCRRCHQEDFCDSCHRLATPHRADWMELHPAEFRKNSESCKVCHPGSFCTDCHELKKAHQLDWTSKHRVEFQRQPRTCDQCHDRTFCSDCHSRYRPHPENWLQHHLGPAKQNPQKCKLCHQEKFCVGCHQGTLPPSHENASWLHIHGSEAVQLSSRCAGCHATQFCMKCHRSHKPPSHNSEWRRLHPIQAKMNDRLCRACHARQDCNRCHRMPMPHPKDFIVAHRPLAKRNRSVCANCHDKNFCMSCHRGTRPSSHVRGWINQHRKSGADILVCDECHTRPFCESCHSSTLPASHKDNWNARHGQVAKKSADDCRRCHSGNDCSRCHGGVQMPHPANWAMEHKKAGGASRAQGSVCYKCHQTDFCKACHAD